MMGPCPPLGIGVEETVAKAVAVGVVLVRSRGDMAAAQAASSLRYRGSTEA